MQVLLASTQSTQPVAWAVLANHTQNFRRAFSSAIIVGKAHATLLCL